MKVTLKVWRQSGPDASGQFVEYPVETIPEMSFLEALDVVNDRLVEQGEEPIAFEHDCREGICGSCGAMVNGRAHGPGMRSTLCQVHMREYKDGDVIVVEPFRAKGFPAIKDLVVDRGAFDRIIQSGGYVSIRTGSAPDANSIPIGKVAADEIFDAAACIGCGACVAACPNASASLFVSAKVSHLGMLPQGQPERTNRVKHMVAKMDEEQFGSCTNHGECQDVCPKGVKLEYIAKMNRDLLKAQVFGD